MSNRVCLKMKDEDNKYICSEEWYNYNIKHNKLQHNTSYTVLTKGFIDSMEDLIKYCLIYYYDVEIPKEYTIIDIYNIVFATGNFEPEDRTCSTCRSNIIFSSSDKEVVYKKFKKLCKQVGKNSKMESDKYFCWHTEDYASNQIIHSYNIEKSYLIYKHKEEI